MVATTVCCIPWTVFAISVHVFHFLSVVFPKWKVLVGVCVAVRLVHVMLDCVTKYMVWLCGGGAVFPSFCHRDLFM